MKAPALQRIAAGLARGRAKAAAHQAEHALELRRIVAQRARADARAGNSHRGRAARIARQLRGLVTERHVRRVLSDISYDVSDAIAQSAIDKATGTHE
jgi:hypothetical protein